MCRRNSRPLLCLPSTAALVETLSSCQMSGKKSLRIQIDGARRTADKGVEVCPGPAGGIHFPLVPQDGNFIAYHALGDCHGYWNPAGRQEQMGTPGSPDS